MRCLLLLAFFFSIVAAVTGQKVEMAPLPVRPSTLIDDLKALRAANQKMDAATFAADANKLLDKQGMNFALFLDAATCTRIREANSKQTDPTKPLTLGGALKSVDGDRTRLSLPPAQISKDECGGCFVEFPLLQITDASFITILMGRNIGFELPGNAGATRVGLLDEKGSVVRKIWRIPRRMRPIGVTHDENVVYLAFPEPELKELSLAVFTEGTFQIATRTEAEEGGKGEPHPAPVLNGMKVMRFARWGKTYNVGYWEPCI